jgi:hypothetical protein
MWDHVTSNAGLGRTLETIYKTVRAVQGASWPGGSAIEPGIDKSVGYRAFKRGFQASRNQSQSIYMALIK